MRWRSAARPVVVAALSGSLALADCGSSTMCDLDSVLRQRAGAGAADCGHVAVGAPTTATDQCITDQIAAGGAFFARYDEQGIDSRVALGVVRDPRGQTSVLHWDSDPSGGGNVGATITEHACGGDPPVETLLDHPGGFPPVDCTVEISTNLLCDGG